MRIAVFAGDGIGPEVTEQAVRVLETLGLPGLELVEGDVGGAAYRKHGHPLPPATLDIARSCDAILFGAVGDFGLDTLERHLRPEQAILGLRKELGLFANLRPARVFEGLESLTSLRPEVAREIDLLIVRELNGDVYFGEKGMRTTPDGRREGYDMMSYAEDEVRRIARTGFEAAMKRGQAAVLGRQGQRARNFAAVARRGDRNAAEYPEVELSHMYVDNAAMQLVKNPGDFDVIVTGNLFGDILSDQASMCVGSIGLLASASLAEGTFGLYEPIHGSAPDIAGKGLANPMATILSAAMMLRYSFALEEPAARIEAAVARALANGVRGGDLGGNAGTREIGDAIVERL